jgi:hypothetical protein
MDTCNTEITLYWMRELPAGGSWVHARIHGPAGDKDNDRQSPGTRCIGLQIGIVDRRFVQ